MAINLAEYPIGTLIEEINEISEGMFENLMKDDTDYESLYARQESLNRRSNEILARPLNQRINYYISLDHNMWFFAGIDDLEEAERFKRAKEQFRINYLDKMPPERLKPHCRSR